MINYKVTVLFIVTVFILCSALCKNTEFTLGNKIDSLWLNGLKYMYRLEFDKAQKQFEKIDPTHPARDLALAGLKWWRYSQNFDDPSSDKKIFEKEFIIHCQNAIDKCEKEIKIRFSNIQKLCILLAERKLSKKNKEVRKNA